jgi:cation diffusion facilitator CzcD-associated flavoprotein CzcO
VEHVDVLIVGAGLSGIGAGYHLQTRCPQKSYLILEARGQLGGTWDLFRYPGIRSDSDMYTMGYRFRPWKDPRAMAEGSAILDYIRETAAEYGIDTQIRFGHRVTCAAWSTDDACWTVEAGRADTGETVRVTCSFLYVCSGYYRYDEGYTPQFSGVEEFAGRIVHPQKWAKDVDYERKRVVVIGSGATAVTLVPALARRAVHVTMLQRSPSYVLSLPGQDPIANRLGRRLPPRAAYALVRWKNVLLTMLTFQLCRRRPELMRSLLRQEVERQLPAGYDIDTHFEPRYNPWDQRLCMVPDGDLFAAIREGRASIVTGEVERFTERGVRLRSGDELDADLIVTATGLNLLAIGGIELAVDGRPVELPKTLSYKGMMLSGVPNFALALGYTNASWTLKADLTSEYVCRVLAHMDAHGFCECRPRRPEQPTKELPLIDFSSGYVLRSIDQLPRQGPRRPWRLYQNYVLDLLMLRYGAVRDGALEFTPRRASRAAKATRAPGPAPASCSRLAATSPGSLGRRASIRLDVCRRFDIVESPSIL